MAMQTQLETYRGYKKKKEISSQTAVECRFGSEVETVLSVHCAAALTGAEAGSGEARYFGKAHFSIVYEDAEKKVCRAEKGVEFTATCKDEEIVPAFSARAVVAVENVAVRREGASVFVTALLGADISFYGDESFEYLAGGDLVLKREPVVIVTAHLCGGAQEVEDEFETELLGDILQHAETACVTDVVCETGSVRIEGEINLCVLALKGESALVSFERLVPFTVEIPCEAAAFGCRAEAGVNVLNVNIRAEADEARGKCAVSAEFTLSAECCVYEDLAVDGATDAFSCENEVKLAFHACEFTAAGEMSRVVERVSGRALRAHRCFRRLAGGHLAAGGGQHRLGRRRKAGGGRRHGDPARLGRGRRAPRRGDEPAVLGSRQCGEQHGGCARVRHVGTAETGGGDRRRGDPQNHPAREAHRAGETRLLGRGG